MSDRHDEEPACFHSACDIIKIKRAKEFSFYLTGGSRVCGKLVKKFVMNEVNFWREID